MKREDFKRVEDIFKRACDLAPHDRAAYLDAACDGDTELRNSVEAILDEDHGTTLDADGHTLRERLAAIWDNRVGADNVGIDDDVPERIGRYGVTRLLGAGGMGRVYEAKQEHPSRTVALKVMHRGIADDVGRRRFQLEVEVLGHLHHVGIAQIYEAGQLDDGRPFFAMERIDGPTLSEYIDREQPDRRSRLVLFQQICEAVQHAHHKGIVHRDLKPANILIDCSTPDRPQVKVLDFGVARVSGTDFDSTSMTVTGQMIGTLSYMSPEQLQTGGEFDTRTDVYALGVILFGLLSDQLPYELDARSPAEAAYLISNTEPRRLKTFDTTLRGDLDTIVAKALRKEPENRYQSAWELAEDVRRHMMRQPIVARPTSNIYRMKKFGSRHPGLVIGVLCTIVALITGTIVSTTLMFSLLAQREDTRQALAESEAVTSFLTQMLTATTPESQAKGLLVRDALDAASDDLLGNEAFDNPITDARVRATIGRVYTHLEEHRSAEPFLLEAMRTRERELGPKHVSTLDSKRAWAWHLTKIGRSEEGEIVARSAYEAAIAELGEDHPVAAALLDALAEAVRAQGRFDDLVPIVEALYAHAVRTYGADSSRALDEKRRLILIRIRTSDFPDAIDELDEMLRQTENLDPRWDASFLVNVAQYWTIRGDFERAETIFMKVSESLEELYPPESESVLKIRTEHAILKSRQGKVEEAKAALSDVRTISRAHLGPTHPHTLWTTFFLGTVLIRNGDLELATGILEQSLEDTDRQMPALIGMLAEAYRRSGQAPIAAELDREAAELPIVGRHPWQRPWEPHWLQY